MTPIRRRNGRGGERGAALVEFALVLPMLLVVIFGVVDFGFVFQRYEVITNAAREGARLATLPGYDSQPLVEARVRAYVQNGLSLSNAAMNTVMPSGAVTLTHADLTVPRVGGGTNTVPTATVQVTYQHDFLLLGPLLTMINGSWGGTITLTSSSQMRVEM
jgi:Flp pilus assembly protein TadG